MGKGLVAAGQPIGNLQNGTEEKLGTSNFLHVQEQKPADTASGTFTAGAWRTRQLSEVLTNNIASASLSAFQISLPAGKYFALGYGSAYRVDRNQIRLAAISPSVVSLVLGMNEYSLSTDGVTTSAIVSGEFDLDVASVIELQHRCSITYNDSGFGVKSIFGEVEVYADLKIWKVA